VTDTSPGATSVQVSSTLYSNLPSLRPSAAIMHRPLCFPHPPFHAPTPRPGRISVQELHDGLRKKGSIISEEDIKALVG